VSPTPFAHSVLVPWIGTVQDWPAATMDDLTGSAL
jgi:hypothetical protein